MAGLTSTYDPMNRLTELSMPPVADYKYTLGATGNRTNATEQSGRALAWNYNNIYRLTGETIANDPANNNGNNGSATYQLDPEGNRTSASSTFSGFSPVAGSYNADDQLLSETYDANGNTTLAANGNSYTYDSENHMTSATGNGKTITMVQIATRMLPSCQRLFVGRKSPTVHIFCGFETRYWQQQVRRLGRSDDADRRALAWI
jgi:hypothetical protein